MKANSSKFKLAALTTVAVSMKAFYEGQFEALNEAGFETFAIHSEDRELPYFLPSETRFIPVNFDRVVTPLKDIGHLWRLFKIFREHKFDIVQYSTPKAALLGAIAAFFARVPIRIYLLWGLYYEGQQGIKRVILKFFERIICSLSTHILPDSREIIGYIQQQGLTNGSKCETIYNGSACGVNLEQFNPEKWKQDAEQVRSKVGIPKDAVVIGVFGRLTGDKGVNEIVRAFKQIVQEHNNVFLLVVGRQEQKDKLLPDTENAINNHPKIIHVTGYPKTLIPYYGAIDIFCLPSYREGFPQSPLEAQAMEKPVITTNIVGARESIIDRKTGFLVEPRNSDALILPLLTLIKNPDLRKKMGMAGRLRVEQKFDRKDMIKAVVDHRLQLLSRLRKE